MATSLPIKTTPDDVNVLANYLKNQVGYTALDKLRAAIPAPHGDARKIETMRFLGLLDVDTTNVKLTDDGRRYAAGDAATRSAVIVDRLRSIPLYSAALDWMHYGKNHAPTKTEVANYWSDKHSAALGDTKGDALTDAAVLFLRFAGAAGAGKFVPAGVGRDTYLKVDAAALEAIVTGTGPEALPTAPRAAPVAGVAPSPDPRRGRPSVAFVPAVNINLEIHIAADATPMTIEEIFKNMRKYVLGSPSDESSVE